MNEVLEGKGHTGTVRFDGQTITILRTGALGRLVVGKGEKHIPLAHPTAVQFKPAGPLVNGFISIHGRRRKRAKVRVRQADD